MLKDNEHLLLFMSDGIRYTYWFPSELEYKTAQVFLPITEEFFNWRQLGWSSEEARRHAVWNDGMICGIKIPFTPCFSINHNLIGIKLDEKMPAGQNIYIRGLIADNETVFTGSNACS